MRKVWFLFLVFPLVLQFSPSYSQFDKKWETRYSETGYTSEIPIKTVSDGDGNFYVLAETGIGNVSNLVVIKYSASGEVVWTFQSGLGTPINAKQPKDIAVDTDGNVIVIASTPS